MFSKKKVFAENLAYLKNMSDTPSVAFLWNLKTIHVPPKKAHVPQVENHCTRSIGIILGEFCGFTN